MQLPISLRESLVNELEVYLGSVGDPEAEKVAEFMLEQLELYADESGNDDLLSDLEDSGGLDGSLQESLEAEMASNDDFEFTEEECVSLFEALCEIEWNEDAEDVDDDDDDDDDF